MEDLQIDFYEAVHDEPVVEDMRGLETDMTFQQRKIWCNLHTMGLVGVLMQLYYEPSLDNTRKCMSATDRFMHWDLDLMKQGNPNDSSKNCSMEEFQTVELELNFVHGSLQVLCAAQTGRFQWNFLEANSARERIVKDTFDGAGAQILQLERELAIVQIREIINNHVSKLDKMLNNILKKQFGELELSDL